MKIWLYGYFQRIRVTRKLEAACREHLSLLLADGPDSTRPQQPVALLAGQPKALRQIFKQTVQVAVRTGAVGLALQALDGTKIQAACSSPKGWSKDSLEKLLAQLEAACDEIELKIVEENADVDQPGYRLPAGLAERKALCEQIKQGLAQMETDGRTHYHPVEPEARRMKLGDTNRYAYNAQALADEKEGVIVACEATRQETDAGQLVTMIQQGREIIEPRFGQIKQHDGFRRWTVWGLDGVKTQWSLLCATLNLRVLYRRWRSGRGPAATSAAAVALKLESDSPSHLGIFACLGRWWADLFDLAMPSSRNWPVRFVRPLSVT